MSVENQGIAILNADQGFSSSLQSILNAAAMTRLAGEEVSLTDVYSAKYDLLVNFGHSQRQPIASKLMDQTTALWLANIQMARFRLPYDSLGMVEQALFTGLDLTNSDLEHPPAALSDSIAEVFCRVGGVALLDGSPLGIARTLGMYDDTHELQR